MTIRVIEFEGLSPAPAYTDFNSVYVSTVLVGEQRRTALRHERAHIFLQHQARRAALVELLGAALNAKAWNIAADLEIARHIYDSRDIDAITAPRSPLMGGITTEHCETFPGIEYAEEYYEKLMDEGIPDIWFSQDGEASDGVAQEVGEQSEKRGVSEIINDAIGSIDELSKIDDAAQSAKQAQKSVDGFKPPKPSLAALVDMHIGRAARGRNESFRRPARHNTSKDLIRKGFVTKQRAPRVTIYVDRSGSFSPEKTRASIFAVGECLRKYRGRVGCDVIYFADHLMHKDPGCGCGGTNYQPVINQIYADRAEISVIITDADSADGVAIPAKMPPVIVVPIECHRTDIGARLGAPHADLEQA